MADDRGSNFFEGLIFGAAVGFVLGILFAPRPGKETREMLKERANEFASDAQNFAEEAKAKGRDLLTGHGVEISEEETQEK
ncbi:MAG: YtxH domain-containing protein [Caldisericaceae bacterium]